MVKDYWLTEIFAPQCSSRGIPLATASFVATSRFPFFTALNSTWSAFGLISVGLPVII
jgi:hypothetical protein